MMRFKDTLSQINMLTQVAIELGLCDDQNYPSTSESPGGIEEVSINTLRTNVFLKNIHYADMYNELNALRAYNLKMIDGALISFQYRFKANRLIAHRLSFFPSPNLAEFQNTPEIYLEDDIYADIVDKRIVTVPIRFDYDSEVSVSVKHPISHMTLGQYKNCRIPVSSAVSPHCFLMFILRHFYHTADEMYTEKMPHFTECFTDCITAEELKHTHLRLQS